MSRKQIRLNVSKNPTPTDVVREVDRLLPTIIFENNLLLRSPDGVLWRIQVSNAGALTAVVAS